MTREEVISYFHEFMDNEPISIPTLEKAMQTAIEALEQEPTTKNDSGVDAISRQAINGYIDYILSHGMGKKKSFDFIKKFVANLPSVTPQEPFINKPCVSEKVCEHDKQMFLDKIRAEIAEYGSIMVTYAITDDTRTDKGIEKLVSDVLQQAKEEVLQIIDKHKAKSEDK